MDIKLEPDMSIEPGHQVIVLDDSNHGVCLAALLSGDTFSGQEDNVEDDEIRVPHTADVDARIEELIDQLSHVRFSASGLLQMTMEEAPKP